MNPVWTIGYERATLANVIEALRDARVELLIDVRAIAASRRAGFSKTVLAANLREASVDYLHLRDLGTPKAGRDAARRGLCEEMRAIFRDHLDEPGAVAAFERLARETSTRGAYLLCFEADPTCCHREVLADRLAERSPITVIHLSPCRLA
jgi:uncharacterized protein (DUF488 family)